MAAEQIEMFQLPNPCVQVCEAGPRGYCIGCLRSREERFNWPQKPTHEKAEILKRLAQRQKRREAFLASQRLQEKQQEESPPQLQLPGLEEN